MDNFFEKVSALNYKIDYLYRYIDARYLKEALMEGYIHFSSPENFNDIFDSICVIEPDSFYEMVIDKEIKSKILLILIKNDEKKLIDFDFEGLTVYELMCILKSKFNLKSYDEIAHYFRSLIGSASRLGNLKVACFSERYDSLLMWAHYACNFAGACIEYDVNKDDILKKYCSKVQYSSKRIKGIGGITSFLKSADWSYELEWRLVGDIGSADHINVSAVKSVYLGPKFEINDILSICEIAKLKKISVYISIASKKEYALVFRKLMDNGKVVRDFEESMIGFNN